MALARKLASAPQPAHPELRSLTPWRGLAAWHVLLFHVRAHYRIHVPFLDCGYTAVSFFFILSGFVLAYRYFDDERRFSARDFFRARFLRLYPVYFLMWAVVLTRQWQQPVWHWLRALLMLQSWFPMEALSWNSPAWSLSVEVFAYATFPLWWKTLRRASPRLCLAVAAGAWALSLTLSFLFTRHWFPFVGERMLAWLKFFPPVRVWEFVIGVALGRWYLTARPRWPGWIAPAVALALIACQAAALLPYPYLHNAGLAPLFAALIIALAQRADRPAWGEWLGEASYAIYLVHMPVLVCLAALLPSLPAAPIGALCLVLSTGAGYLIHVYWEKPCRRFLSAKIAAA